MNKESDTDYYQVLNLLPTAGSGEIKKAFRQLAMRYHPDRNFGNPEAAEKFSQIQKAYRVLSDRNARTAYHFHRYAGKQANIFTMPVADAATLLSLSKRLSDKLSLQDPFRIDRDQLYFEINLLLKEDKLVLLLDKNDPKILLSFLGNITKSAAFLSHPLWMDIAEKLKTTVGNHSEAERLVQAFIRSSQHQFFWNRYKIWIALVFTLLCCGLLYYSVHG